MQSTLQWKIICSLIALIGRKALVHIWMHKHSHTIIFNLGWSVGRVKLSFALIKLAGVLMLRRQLKTDPQESDWMGNAWKPHSIQFEINLSLPNIWCIDTTSFFVMSWCERWSWFVETSPSSCELLSVLSGSILTLRNPKANITLHSNNRCFGGHGCA